MTAQQPANAYCTSDSCTITALKINTLNSKAVLRERKDIVDEWKCRKCGHALVWTRADRLIQYKIGNKPNKYWARTLEKRKQNEKTELLI